MNGLISIIVPVYNAENQLRKCVESILFQTYKNIELILIDDGSVDNSPLICDEYAQMDNRVKVIHKENGGVSSSRNIGLAAASGEYIGFVDADDWLDNDMYEYLFQSIKSSDADISCCGYFREYEEKTEVISKENDMVSNSFDDILNNFIDGKYGGAIWNKLFKRSVIRHDFDNRLAIGEDAYFLFQVLKNTQRIVYKSEPKYHYFIRVGSATNVPFNSKRLDTLDSVDRIYNDIKNNFPTHEKKARVMVFNKYLAILNLILYYDRDIDYKTKINSITERLLGIVKSTRLRDHTSKFRYFSFMFYRFNKLLYRRVVKTYYKKKLI